MISEYLRIFRAFSDATRVRVLEMLCEGEQCACVLLEDMKISQPTLSHHMKILCESGIVKFRQVGRWRYYSINADGCEHGSRLLKALAKNRMDNVLNIAQTIHLLLSPFRKRSRLPKAAATIRDDQQRRRCDL
ncbi:MAG: metalloregulator ArsR/SmtB family transcription factor [Deltaproteobacteria bacterium]|jgi:ArsR family transcriptional regulator|nr:metalloregulator ArsR/SmtB family transcription factor [Deltaproteobacteria bacterium]